MNKSNGSTLIFLIIVISILSFIPVKFIVKIMNTFEKSKLNFISKSEQPSPTPYQFPYKNPDIPKNGSYRIIIVGDSIVASLGINANTLRQELIKLYPDSEFVTYNYGYPATNIETLTDRLTKTTTDGVTDHPAILEQGFELIILESFAYNPLSHLTLGEGLKKQNEILESSVNLILNRKPKTALAFLTPLAFDSKNFARGTYNLSAEVRKSWINEREAYIENHKRFAKSLEIPVIDIYSLSKNTDGEVKKELISEDFIHPSQQGVDFISKTIADFIYQNKIFPK